MDIIVGTAGHIDHGKTALVKSLTGIDADRLPEEKQRGITIDIGFAELDLGDLRIGFVDVPGHERFVKNMLAGASGIDAVLLVIAADAGVMPQTREHFEICRLLEIKSGLIVLTKTDLVDAELLELVRLEAAELVENSFLENAPIVAVSAKTDTGIADLKSALENLAAEIPERRNELIARLPIDRVFSVKGFGAVVTGTLGSGEIAEGTEMELLPAAKSVRVRGVQNYGKSVKTARAGQRTAVNLGGVDHAEIVRGMVLAERGVLRPTQIFDAEIEVLKSAKKSLKSRQRVRVHIGTIEVLGRVQVLNDTNEIAAGETDFVQIRLEMPIVCVPNERFIIRRYSPQITIAGGKVLDNAAAKHRPKDAESVGKYLNSLLAAETQKDPGTMLRLYLETADEHGLTLADLQHRTGWQKDILRRVFAETVEKRAIVKAEKFYVARAPFERLKAKTVAQIEEYHRREPLARGIGRETLREQVFSHVAPDIFKRTLESLETENKIIAEKDFVRRAGHNFEISGDEQIVRERLGQIYKAAQLSVPTLADALAQASQYTKLNAEHARKVFQILLNAGEVIKVTSDFYFAAEVVAELEKKIKEFAVNSSDRLIDVARFKDIAGISRKYAIPLLEYFDREKITRRAGDKRLIL